MIHETNHNYQVDNALFKRRTHGETNQLNMLNLSILNDNSRWRNPRDLSEGGVGGAIYNNSYTTINEVNNIYKNNKHESEEVIHEKTGEYLIYAMLIHKLGPYKYLDYIRWDQVKHPNTSSTWNGFDEIRALSEFFKINFFEAFFYYSKNWNEDDKYAWPTSYENASDEQKKLLINIENIQHLIL